jgi:hypothetical protein
MYSWNDIDYSIEELMTEHNDGCSWPKLKADFHNYLMPTPTTPDIPQLLPKPTPTPTTPKLPILRSILAKIATSSNSIPGVNTDAAFCLAFAGCLRMGEISYTDKQRSKLSFAATKATRLDIQFSPSGDYLTFRLKRSKTDKDKQGV